jgi:hypothetical protein
MVTVKVKMDSKMESVKGLIMKIQEMGKRRECCKGQDTVDKAHWARTWKISMTDNLDVNKKGCYKWSKMSCTGAIEESLVSHYNTKRGNQALYRWVKIMKFQDFVSRMEVK